jgi:4'-phosphopantetheinyl transferase
MKDSQTSGTAWRTIRQPLELSSDVVHVVRLQLDLPPERWIPLNECLTADEQARAARFRFDSSRQQFVACRATLRRLLSPLCQMSPDSVPLHCGNHGKPELSLTSLNANVPRIEFNVSHSGRLGLIALTIGSSVGIDVEEWDSKVQILKLAERFFSPEEAAELNRLTPEKQPAGFYRGWTCKEAYIKAKGSGLSLSLSSFRVEIDPDRPASLCHVDDQPNECANWSTQSLDVGENYAAAVMVAQPKCRIECWDWREGELQTG